MVDQPLEVVVASAIGTSCERQKLRLGGRAWCWCWQAAPHVLWFLCLMATSACLGSDFPWPWSREVLGILGLLVLTASCATVFFTHSYTADAGPLLATLALLLWRVGGMTSNSPGDWCITAVQAAAKNPARLHSKAAVGLLLLDDMLRIVLRFVANTPKEAVACALTNHHCYSLWLADEDWWAACYKGAQWMRLPPRSGEGELEGRHRGPTPRGLLREALLWGAMLTETLGILVILQPGSTSSVWVATPCVASSLLMLCCSPWLPRQSELVLVEMVQLMRLVGRFAFYFQVVWFVVLVLVLRPSDLADTMVKDSSMFRMLEMAAIGVLYTVVIGRLWAVAARCRAASPLYAISAEELVPEPSHHSRPFYCGKLGNVEGSYAPTQMCNWEELGPRGVSWRDRYALHRCADVLLAREAHLLSNLDALQVRLREADECFSACPWSARRIRSCVSANRLLGLVAVVLCLCTSRRASSFQSSGEVPHLSNGLNFTEALLWTLLLIRVASGWYIAMRSFQGWEATSQASYSEALTLRQQACSLHRCLAETQWMLKRCEARVQALGVGLTARPAGRGQDWMLDSALRVLMVSWVSFFLMPFLLRPSEL